MILLAATPALIDTLAWLTSVFIGGQVIVDIYLLWRIETLEEQVTRSRKK